jgi:hypothetical protein
VSRTPLCQTPCLICSPLIKGEFDDALSFSGREQSVATFVVVVFVGANQDLSNAVDQPDGIDVVPVLHFNVRFSSIIPATHTSAFGFLTRLCTLQFTTEPKRDLITGDSVSDA